MRIKTQIEPAETITAAIFNKVAGPGAEPVGTYQELRDDEAPPDELKEWEAIERAIRHLPADAVAALSALLKESETAGHRGYVHGLVRAARIAYQRWQNEQARDLLIEADIKSVEALETSGADLADIHECRALFKDWNPTQEDAWLAIRRNQPTPMRGVMFKAAHSLNQQNAE